MLGDEFVFDEFLKAFVIRNAMNKGFVFLFEVSFGLGSHRSGGKREGEKEPPGSELGRKFRCVAAVVSVNTF